MRRLQKAGFEAVYLSSEWACYSMDYKWIHIVSIVALIISLVATWIAFVEFKSAGGLSIEGNSDLFSRPRFMAMIGLLTGALFTTLIFATWLPTLAGVPCTK